MEYSKETDDYDQEICNDCEYFLECMGYDNCIKRELWNHTGLVLKS